MIILFTGPSVRAAINPAHVPYGVESNTLKQHFPYADCFYVTFIVIYSDPDVAIEQCCFATSYLSNQYDLHAIKLNNESSKSETNPLRLLISFRNEKQKINQYITIIQLIGKFNSLNDYLKKQAQNKTQLCIQKITCLQEKCYQQIIPQQFIEKNDSNYFI